MNTFYVLSMIAVHSELTVCGLQDEEISSMLQLLNTGIQQRSARQVAPVAGTSPLGVRVEVKEDDKSLTFLASLSGFSKDDIKVVQAFTCTCSPCR